jgi:hypothetical protein
MLLIAFIIALIATSAAIVGWKLVVGGPYRITRREQLLLVAIVGVMTVALWLAVPPIR